MESKRIKIDLDNNQDKYIKINLNQSVDMFKLLTLNLSQREIYQSFNADFGVLVGRVNANGSVGIPNVKISIFIPISDIDKENSDIVQYYPYENPNDLNINNKRYNLLPRVGRVDPSTQEIKPKQPFGSFPTLEELNTNETLFEVYEKYYKYTTVTNNSGDYMLYGVPIGVQTVHMSVDVTDIGEYSMSPSTMVTNLGYSPNLFTENSTKIKESEFLDELPHIETQEVTVDIIPFWGDVETYEIGITRQDFKIRAELLKNFVIFGTTYTGAEEGNWGRGSERDKDTDAQLFKINNKPNGEYNLVFDNYRIGKPIIKVFSYLPTLSDSEISGGTNIDINTDILLLDENDYNLFTRDGDFIVSIPCNRKKVITNEAGEKIEVDVDNPNGIFTEFKGYITVEYDNDDSSVPLKNPEDGRGLRGRLKIPQNNHLLFDYEEEESQKWIKNHFTFEGGKYYTVSMFNHIQNRGKDRNWASDSPDPNQVNNMVIDYNVYNFGILLNEHEGTSYTGNTSGLLANGYDEKNNRGFGAEWLNMALHLIEYNEDRIKGGSTWHVTSALFKEVGNALMQYPNQQPIGGGVFDNSRFIRGDYYKTTFVEVNKNDIFKLFEYTPKGVRNYSINDNINNVNQDFDLMSEFMVGGKKLGIPSGDVETNGYLYKGLYEANCIEFLFQNNLI